MYVRIIASQSSVFFGTQCRNVGRANNSTTYTDEDGKGACGCMCRVNLASNEINFIWNNQAVHCAVFGKVNCACKSSNAVTCLFQSAGALNAGLTLQPNWCLTAAVSACWLPCDDMSVALPPLDAPLLTACKTPNHRLQWLQNQEKKVK